MIFIEKLLDIKKNKKFLKYFKHLYSFNGLLEIL